MHPETSPEENPYLRTIKRNVEWIRNLNNDDQLTLRPPFQRNLVWTETQQSFLIDTILNGYPIPELYMQESADKSAYVVVDGQQRLSSCLLFLDGSLVLVGDEISVEWVDLKYESLSPDLKQMVLDYEFIIRLLPPMPDAELSLIFQRLNRNVKALNAQELRHATYWGEFISSVEQTAQNAFWEESGIFTRNDFRRMLDAEFISELYVAVLHGIPNKKERLDQWYEVYESEFEQRKEVEDLFAEVIAELEGTLPRLRHTRWRKKSDFYTLFLVFAEHQDDLPLSRKGREKAREKLTTFATRVDNYVRKGRLEADAGIPKYVATYGEAVQRAASDRANRMARRASVEQLLSPVWTS